MTAMHRYLAGVLSVIAVGVVAIAYALAFPAATTGAIAPASGVTQPGLTQAVLVNGTLVPVVTTDAAGRLVAAPAAPYGTPSAVPVAYAAPASTAPVAERGVVAMPVSYGTTEPMVVRTAPRAEVVQTVDAEPAPRRVVRQRVSRASDEWDDSRDRRRDWKKTAMIVGGTTAASAGLGGIFGGKKGALIGAAIGGGASTIYETTRR